jgi:hypothetical protein
VYAHLGNVAACCAFAFGTAIFTSWLLTPPTAHPTRNTAPTKIRVFMPLVLAGLAAGLKAFRARGGERPNQHQNGPNPRVRGVQSRVGPRRSSADMQLGDTLGRADLAERNALPFQPLTGTPPNVTRALVRFALLGTKPTAKPEWRNALTMLEPLAGAQRITVGSDKGYDVRTLRRSLSKARRHAAP